MAKPQRPDAGTIERPRQGKPSPAKPPAEGYDTPHEGAVRDEGTENQGGKWQPRQDSPAGKNAKDR
jgi:hypothetical protein